MSRCVCKTTECEFAIKVTLIFIERTRCPACPLVLFPRFSVNQIFRYDRREWGLRSNVREQFRRLREWDEKSVGTDGIARRFISNPSARERFTREACVGRNGARTAAAEAVATKEGRRRKPRERNSCCSKNGRPCLKQNRRLTWATPGESFDFACVTVFNVKCLDDDSADEYGGISSRDRVVLKETSLCSQADLIPSIPVDRTHYRAAGVFGQL